MFHPSGWQQSKDMLVGEGRMWGRERPAGGDRNYSYLCREEG